MWYYTVKDPPNELYHHGIKGQKWGDKNGPPYPLGASSHSLSEKKEGTKGWAKKAKSEHKSYGKSKSDPESEQTKKKSGLTNKQKKAIKIGAVVAVSVLAAYGGYKLYKSGKLDDLIEKGKNVLSKNKKIQDTIDESTLSDTIKNAMNSIKNDDYEPASGVFDYQQVAKLTDDEIRAIQGYTTPLYREANKYLRSSDGNGTVAGKMIGDSMKSALNKVSISKDVSVMRGVNGMTAESILGSDNLDTLRKLKQEYILNCPTINIKDLKGIKNKDNGVMSTTIPNILPNGKISSGIASDFTLDDGIIFDIKAKAGSKGMYIAPLSELKAERELVFAPGSSLVMDGTATLINGVWYVGAILMQ